MHIYDPGDHYWLIGDESPTTQVFSSASGSLVPLNDPTYQAWLSTGRLPTIIELRVELVQVLSAQHPAAVAARAALARSDTTSLRCFEAGTSLAADWIAYRRALRAVVAAPCGATLPTAPTFPAGS